MQSLPFAAASDQRLPPRVAAWLRPRPISPTCSILASFSRHGQVSRRSSWISPVLGLSAFFSLCCSGSWVAASRVRRSALSASQTAEGAGCAEAEQLNEGIWVQRCPGEHWAACWAGYSLSILVSCPRSALRMGSNGWSASCLEPAAGLIRYMPATGLIPAVDSSNFGPLGAAEGAC